MSQCSSVTLSPAPHQLDATIRLASYRMRQKNSHSLVTKNGRTCGQQIRNSDVQRNAGAQDPLDAVRQEACPEHVLMHPICSLHQVSRTAGARIILAGVFRHVGWSVFVAICNRNLGKLFIGVRFDGRTSHLFATRKILLLRFLQKKCGIPMCNKAGDTEENSEENSAR